MKGLPPGAAPAPSIWRKFTQRLFQAEIIIDTSGRIFLDSNHASLRAAYAGRLHAPRKSCSISPTLDR
jgi:hypothetical protein